jgi:hypothetical protein
MDVHGSARKHGIEAEDMEHAVAYALVALDEENEQGISQVLYLGWNRTGTSLLEVVVLEFDDGREMIIHAMNMQARYERFLPRNLGDV